MARPYSVDLRERAVAAVERDGLSRHGAAAQFGVGISTVIAPVCRFRNTGSVRPGQMGGHKPRAIAGEHRAWLLERTREKDFTLRGLVAELDARGLKVDYRSVWNSVHAEKLSFKKRRRGQRTRSARHRAQWKKYQGWIEPERLIFIDETWTKTNMAPLRGWAPPGMRLTAKARTATGRPRPSWPRCVATGSMLPGFSMVRSTARASEFTSRRSSSPP